LICVSAHTHRQSTGAGCDPATEIVDVVGTGARDRLDCVSHPAPEIEAGGATLLLAAGIAVAISTLLVVGGCASFSPLRLLAQCRQWCEE